MTWLPNGEKTLMICSFVLSEFTNVTDRQTEEQTPHDDIGRACIASRGKNTTEKLKPMHSVHRASTSPTTDGKADLR